MQKRDEPLVTYFLLIGLGFSVAFLLYSDMAQVPYAALVISKFLTAFSLGGLLVAVFWKLAENVN